MYIADRKSKGHSVQFSAKSYALAGKWPFRYEKCTASAEEVPGSGFPRCIHGDYVVFIDSEGSVYPCCNFWGRQKLNVRSEGVAKCILQLDRASCSRCYIPAYIDRNLFFNIEPATWVNYLKHSLRGES
jgi:MoaA/NifB/PqqE/SkfB family radical SAM enzyme